ncbi:MAG: M15 family metallopeptidase [Actinomycetota bacterium]
MRRPLEELREHGEEVPRGQGHGGHQSHVGQVILAALCITTLIGCGGGDDDADAAAPGTAPPTSGTTRTMAPSSTSSTTERPAPSATNAATTAPRPVPPPATAAPPQVAPAAPAPTAPYSPVAGYGGVVAPVDAARLSASWRAGCPVSREHLRLLTLPYVGYDGAEHTGEMVVHGDVADAVVGVLAQLFGARFPIARMELVDVYGGDDDRSMMTNNTSAFNCRAITGGGRWSEHAYGKAVDINPVENPYVYRDGHVLDPAAAPYTDRTRANPGMIKAGDVVVSAFYAIGWGWGGNFSSIKDYQHFSASGG